MDAGKTNIALCNITLGKRNEIIVLILTPKKTMFYAKFVDMLLTKQRNCKSIQWRPDGEYYKIKLFFFKFYLPISLQSVQRHLPVVVTVTISGT